MKRRVPKGVWEFSELQRARRWAENRPSSQPRLCQLDGVTAAVRCRTDLEGLIN